MAEAGSDHPTPGTDIGGWMSPEQLDWLSAQATEMQSVVEVGSFRGRSAFALLGACDGPVYCIDPWPGPRYDHFMNRCGHFPNLVAIRGRSPEAAAQVPDVDMVFLDGDHRYTSVLADIEAWLPKTRKLLCGHDYGHPNFPGVARAVDELFADRVVPAGPGSLAAIWTVPARS
jgi:methyltransferase family protein